MTKVESCNLCKYCKTTFDTKSKKSKITCELRNPQWITETEIGGGMISYEVHPFRYECDQYEPLVKK